MDDQVERILRDFFASYKRITFKAGDIILSPDQLIPGVFLLIHGEVRSYALSSTGTELTINLFKPISIFPMNWVINDTKNRYFYDSLGDTEVFLAPKTVFLKLFKKNPQIALDLLTRIYKGLDGYMMRMEALLGGDAYTKLLVHLLVMSRRTDSGHGKAVLLSVSHKHLASETGLTRETVTREIKKLKDKKLINKQRDALLAVDMIALEQELLLHL